MRTALSLRFGTRFVSLSYGIGTRRLGLGSLYLGFAGWVHTGGVRDLRLTSPGGFRVPNGRRMLRQPLLPAKRSRDAGIPQ